jgi:hypothetical protein
MLEIQTLRSKNFGLADPEVFRVMSADMPEQVLNPSRLI